MSDRFEGLPQETVDTARQAKCTRCEAVVVDELSVLGVIMVSYYVPALGLRQRAILCGACGLLLRELLVPKIVEDPLYQTVKAELLGGWG